MHRYKEWLKNLERLIEKVNFDIWMYKYIGMAGLRFLRFFLGILVYLFRFLVVHFRCIEGTFLVVV